MKKEPGTTFEGKASELFNESVEQLDGATLSRLNQGRHKALEELQRLYEEVREYAAPIVLAKDQVNIVSLLNEAWRHHHFREDEQVKLDLQFADSTNSKHYILDLHRIHQVLRNLLENAIFASLSSDPKEATKQPTVTVKIYEDGSYLFLEVMDQGPGIESKKR